MAQTSWGFDGTINEAQWSEMAGLLGNGYVAADSASCVVTAVPGARSVSVSAGTLYGDGIVTVLDAAETVAMTTPVNGQWYVIALRRTWATNSTALVAIAGATTSTSTPTAPPSTLPTLNADPGVLTDQPISWAWCNSANTTVVVYDMRQFPVRRMPLTVASAAVRDGIFQTPTQGQQVWRNDLGAVETYFGAFNAISNPGGRDTAGWFVSDRNSAGTPVKATSVTVASGSATENATGFTFTGATTLTIDGFVKDPTKFYKIVMILAGSVNNTLTSRFVKNGTILTAGYYGANTYVAYNQSPVIDNNRDNAATAFIGYSGNFGSIHEVLLKTGNNGAMYSFTCYGIDRAAYNSGGYSNVASGAVNATGIYIAASSGTFSGNINIYEISR